MLELDPTRGAVEALAPGADPRCPRCGVHLLGETSSHCPRCGIDPRSPDAKKRHWRQAPMIVELFLGGSYFVRGLYTIARHPRVWATAAIPFIVNALVAIGMTFLVMPSLVAWLRWLTAPDALATWTGWLALPRHAFEFLGWSVRFAPALVVPGLTAWLLSAPPFRQIFAVSG